mgnify:FL=1
MAEQLTMGSLEEQPLGNSFEKVFIGNAGTATSGLDITDLFSTYLYDGTAANQTITNGIDLAGEGGLVWVKGRTNSQSHGFFDTERGVSKALASDANWAEFAYQGVNAFYSSGFRVGYQNEYNQNGLEYVSWTFRKAPKFFDVVTYTGNGVSGRQIAHNLGSAPGIIMIKRTNATDDWSVFHKDAGGILELNNTGAAGSGAGIYTDAAEQTSTVFRVFNNTTTNASGSTYVAYLFAHNDSGDGEFGPDSDQDIVKCGSYTGNGSATGPVIDLGFEPQWLLVKRSDAGTDQWLMLDTMRGWPSGGTVKRLWANGADSEGNAAWASMYLSATGFQPAATDSTINTNGATYIYMAIRRGPLAQPEAGTEVFAMDMDGATNNHLTSGFPVDLGVYKSKLNTYNWSFNDRLRGAFTLKSNSTAAESGNTLAVFDNNTGWGNSSGFTSEYPSWMWKRAPSFFDVVAYTGDGTSGSYAHNLGVVPELKIIKNRNSSGGWTVGGSGVTGGTTAGYLVLSTTAAKAATSGEAYWGSVDSDTTFSVRAGNSGSNMSGRTYIAYLFATLAGVSKVGSVTHSGTTNVDCGFSAGARFVMLKRTDATGDWYVWDSVRGIIAGNDPYLLLNSTAAEVTNTDYIDPLTSGFTISDNFTDGDYIFYAIA